MHNEQLDLDEHLTEAQEHRDSGVVWKQVKTHQPSRSSEGRRESSKGEEKNKGHTIKRTFFRRSNASETV